MKKILFLIFLQLSLILSSEDMTLSCKTDDQDDFADLFTFDKNGGETANYQSIRVSNGEVLDEMTVEVNWSPTKIIMLYKSEKRSGSSSFYTSRKYEISRTNLELSLASESWSSSLPTKFRGSYSGSCEVVETVQQKKVF